VPLTLLLVIPGGLYSSRAICSPDFFSKLIEAIARNARSTEMLFQIKEGRLCSLPKQLLKFRAWPLISNTNT
jgi:hypothetical protein